MENDQMKNFILKDLTHEGQSFEDAARVNFQNFLEGGLYTKSLTQEDGGNLIFTRAKVRKSTLLTAKDKTKINFPVDLYFEFGREYIISNESGVFEVTWE